MTPRSLMGLFVVVMLALPASLFAAGWVQITAGSSTYFISQGNLKDLDKPGVTRALYLDASSKKESPYQLQKQADGKYAVVQGKGKDAKVVVAGATAQPVAEKKKNNSTAGNTSGDPVEQAVAASTAISADKKPYAQKILGLLKTGKPEEYKKMAAGGASAVDKVLKAISDGYTAAGGDPGKGYDGLVAADAQGSSKLKVALDDRAGGTVGSTNPQKTVPSEDGKPVGNTGDQKGGKTENKILPVVLTAAVTKNAGPAAVDIGNRLFQYLTGKEGGDYLAPALRADTGTLERLKGVTKAWVEDRIKQGKAAEAAELYFVIGSGSGAPPSWVLDADVLAALAQGTTARRPIFYENMKPWTGTKIAGQAERKPIGQGKPDQEVGAFLADAADHAHKVLAESRVKVEISKSIISHEDAPIVPGQVGKGGGFINAPTKGFSWESLYLKGGAVGDVWAPGDPVMRKMSVKVFTVKENGVLVDKLAVFDVTYPNETFGQTFTLGQSGDKTFALDDRQPGWPKYTLKMTPTTSGETEISFLREGGEKGGTISTKLSDLYAARAQQAVDEGNSVNINGKDYTVLGQGGVKGSLLFFPAGGSADSRPELVSEISERSPDGRNVNQAGPRSLGKVGDKFWHLEFNDKLQYWEVKEGEVKDTPPPTTTTTTTDPNATTNTNTNTNTNTTTTTTPDVDTQGIEHALLANGEYEFNQEVSDGLAQEYREKVRVYNWKAKDANGQLSLRNINQRHPMIVPAEVRKARNTFVMFAVDKNYDGMTALDHEVRGIGKYLAASSKLYTTYADLSKPAPLPKEGLADTVFETDLTCLVDEKTKNLCVKDLVLLKDAMTRGGFTEQEISVAQMNAQKIIGSRSGYEIKGNKSSSIVAVVYDVGTANVWPTASELENPDGTHADTKPGPSNGFDGKTVMGPDAPFPPGPEDTKLDNNNIKLYQIKTEGGGALYADAAKGDESKIKTWWVMFKVKNNDDKLLRTGFIKVTDAEKGITSDKIHVAGTEGRRKPLLEMAGNATTRLRRADGKLVVYVVENKAIEAADDAATTKTVNCVGPVFWYGMDEGAALKACQNNGF